jgi:hypothetical protein
MRGFLAATVGLALGCGGASSTDLGGGARALVTAGDGGYQDPAQDAGIVDRDSKPDNDALSSPGEDFDGSDASNVVEKPDAMADPPPPAPCGMTCTTGCCDSAGHCQNGSHDTACGGAGGHCADCTAAASVCISGSCSAAPRTLSSWKAGGSCLQSSTMKVAGIPEYVRVQCSTPPASVVFTCDVQSGACALADGGSGCSTDGFTFPECTGGPLPCAEAASTPNGIGCCFYSGC